MPLNSRKQKSYSKDFLCFFIFIAFLLSSCGGVTPIPAVPTPTMLIPSIPAQVSAIDISPRAITLKNAANVVELERWGKGAVHHIKWSPDGKTIAIAGALGVYIYNAETLIQKIFIETPSPTTITYSQDGRSIAAGGCLIYRSDVIGCAQAWTEIHDVESGRLISQFSPSNDDAGPVSAFSPDGLVTATIACNDNRGLGVGCVETKITLWDIKSGSKLCTLTGLNGLATNATFSPDGNFIFSFSSGNWNLQLDPTATFWNTSTCESVAILNSPALNSYDLFSEQIKDPMFTSGWRGQILQKTIKHLDIIKSFYTGEKYAYQTSLDQNSNMLALAFGKSGGNQLEFWDIATSAKKTSFPVTEYLQSLSFDPNEELISGLTFNKIIVWNIKTRKIIRQVIWEDRYDVETSGVLENGQWVVAGTNRRDSIYLIDPLKGDIIKAMDAEFIRNVYLSPNARILGAVKDSYSHEDKGFSLWDTETEKELFSSPEPVYSMAFSPNGRYLAIGTFSKKLILLDLINPQEPVFTQLNVNNENTGGVNQIQFTHDGNFLFAGSWDEDITIWSIPDGQLRYTLKEVFAAYFQVSPNQKMLVAVSPRNITRLNFLDIESLLNPAIKSSIAPDSIQDNYLFKSDFTYSPDGGILAWHENYNYGNLGTIQLWDTENKFILKTLEGHKTPVSFLTFSPDGQYIISSGYDGTIRLWGLQ